MSPKTFGQLLTDNGIYIDISSIYALACKELCWLNYDVYKNPKWCLKLLNTVHCRHNNYSLHLAGPWNTICEEWCNTDQITFSVEVDQIWNSDALRQLLITHSCIEYYERDGEEKVFKVTCDKATIKCCRRQCKLICIIIPYFFICKFCLGVLVAHLSYFTCTDLTPLYSFFRFPGLCTLRWNKRGMHIERTITLKYIIIFTSFIYWNKYVHECYLAEPGVRSSSHTSLSSICLLAGFKCEALSFLSLHSVCIHQKRLSALGFQLI